jgi:hypothetical protein
MIRIVFYKPPKLAARLYDQSLDDEKAPRAREEAKPSPNSRRCLAQDSERACMRQDQLRQPLQDDREIA